MESASRDSTSLYDTVIVGGGPIGLACAIELKRRGLTVLIVEQGSVADAVRRFPTEMTFFSTAELIELGGVPLILRGIRPSRFDALKYYIRLAEAEQLEIERFTTVVSLAKNGDVFEVRAADGRVFRGQTAIFATGYFGQPNRLEVPGEDLAHVAHYYDEGLKYSKMRTVVVGGQNSACDTALDLYRSGASVTLVHRQAELGHSVKYWVRPDIENRIKAGEVRAFFSHRILSIARESVAVENLSTGAQSEIPADFVFLMTGYHPNVQLLTDAGVQVDPESLKPSFDAETFETNIPGLYVAGSITAGKRTSSIFIENGRVHAQAIAAHIAPRGAEAAKS